MLQHSVRSTVSEGSDFGIESFTAAIAALSFTSDMVADSRIPLVLLH